MTPADNLERAVESYYESMQEDHAAPTQAIARSAQPEQPSNIGDLPRSDPLIQPYKLRSCEKPVHVSIIKLFAFLQVKYNHEY